MDRNIHIDGTVRALIGETAEWAIAETEAGRDWNITHAVAKSGASVTVSFTLKRSQLEFIGAAGTPTVEPGAFDLWLAPSAQTGTPVRFTLTA